MAPDDPEHAALRARYLAEIDGAERIAALPDFGLWRMHEVVRVRVIAGFGKIAWIEGARWRR